MKTKFSLTETQNTYKFGNDLHKFQGSTIIRIPILDAMDRKESVDAIFFNVPSLKGLDVLIKYKMIVDSVHNKHICYAIPCKIRLAQKMLTFIYNGLIIIKFFSHMKNSKSYIEISCIQIQISN